MERLDLFCFIEEYSMENISYETVSKCIQNGLGHHFEKWRVSFSFHRSGCHYQPRLLHRACFEEPSV
jgi:hypothetical protein